MTPIYRWSQVMALVLCTSWIACSSDDGDEPSSTRGDDGGDDGGGDGADGGVDGQGADGGMNNMAECEGPSDCPNVVCDCQSGPVNHRGCNFGMCATRDDCAQVCRGFDEEDMASGGDSQGF